MKKNLVTVLLASSMVATMLAGTVRRGDALFLPHLHRLLTTVNRIMPSTN